MSVISYVKHKGVFTPFLFYFRGDYQAGIFQQTYVEIYGIIIKRRGMRFHLSSLPTAQDAVGKTALEPTNREIEITGSAKHEPAGLLRRSAIPVS